MDFPRTRERWLAWLTGAALLAGCSARLSKETIERHPTLTLEIVRPQVVDASDPEPPRWVRIGQAAEVAQVRFTGQSSAESLDEAKARATRDLFAAVASYVMVDVESEFASEESQDASGNVSVSAKESVRAKSQASVTGVRTEATYWEKVASPLNPTAASYRVYVHGRVSKAAIVRARLEKQLARQKELGRRAVVVLPFRPESPSFARPALADVLVEEISRRLGGDEALLVSDPELVRSMIEAGQSETEWVEAVSSALVPDVIVAGSYAADPAAGLARVTYTIYAGAEARVLHAATLEGGLERPFELTERLIGAVALALRARPEAPRGEAAPPPSFDAVAAYAEAHRAFLDGRNEAAVGLLEAAIAAAPSFGRAHLRLGRVLERVGRAGRPAPSSPDTRTFPLEACLEVEEVPLGAVAPPAPGAEIATDSVEVLSAAVFLARGGFAPRIGLPARSDVALAAYFRAAALADEQEDLELLGEALVAIGDAALRLDYPEWAAEIFRGVVNDAVDRRDPGLESFARLGLGRVLLRLGARTEAVVELERALAARQRLGEKPYIVEILNELGAAQAELLQLDRAKDAYRRAFRLAEALDNRYLLAVLSNNLGILELLLGHPAAAAERFERADDELTAIDEAEGRFNVATNRAHLALSLGDLEGAAEHLGRAKEILARSDQLRKRAHVTSYEAAMLMIAGEPGRALPVLATSYATYQKIGAWDRALRVRNNVVVAALERFRRRGLGAAERACIKGALGSVLGVGYDAFARPEGVGYEVARLNAAIGEALE